MSVERTAGGRVRRRWPVTGRPAVELATAAEPSLVNDIMALGSRERVFARHRRAPERFWQRTRSEA